MNRAHAAPLNTGSENDVSGTEWATLVHGLSAAERARRLEAVTVLLAHPDAISTPLESELYILRDQLWGDGGESVAAGGQGTSVR